ncbi:MAG: Ig-like domain-containing protein [Gemmatimonadaceae bacterium]|nr:Ig-like domain-containing protein [Gemmatimonadaceae bacterium]
MRGKIENLAQQVSKGKRDQVVKRAHDVVDFVLDKNEHSPLPGGDVAVTLLVNAIYCFAGIPIAIDDAGSSRLIFPLDQPQILYDEDSTSAISFPGDPVFEPTLVTITRNENSQLGLLTKLDRYPGYIRIEQQNAGGTKLKYNVTVTVCAEGVPVDVFPDLRLGHGLGDSVLVITPTPMAGDPPPTPLSCDEPAPALTLGARLIRAAANLLSPTPLHAVVQDTPRRGGGVSGTVSEFSPFEPVDTKLRAGGGVSGTVSEFTRMLPMSSLMAEGGVETVLPPTADCTTRPVGNPLPEECYPVVSVTTRQGTILENVPVTWQVPAGSPGTIAARSGPLGELTCGSFGSTATTATSANGNAGVCWTLGGVGFNTVVATPGVGGDAPEGVVFDNNGETSVVFEVDVTPLVVGAPVVMEVVAGSGVSAPAGTTVSPQPRVIVKDANGLPVPGVPITWDLRTGGSISATTSVTGADGTASVAWTFGTKGYQLLKAFYTGPTVVLSVYFEGNATAP